MVCGTAAWIVRVRPGSTSFPNLMVATGHDPRSGGRKFREIAEEMCGKEDPTLQLRFKGKGGPYGKKTKVRVVPMSHRVRRDTRG
jgi:hypothetical protein